MDAVASENLRTFNLDFDGDSFGTIQVNGVPAAARQADEDIVITPATMLRAGSPVVLRRGPVHGADLHPGAERPVPVWSGSRRWTAR